MYCKKCNKRLRCKLKEYGCPRLKRQLQSLLDSSGHETEDFSGDIFLEFIMCNNPVEKLLKEYIIKALEDYKQEKIEGGKCIVGSLKGVQKDIDIAKKLLKEVQESGILPL